MGYVTKNGHATDFVFVGRRLEFRPTAFKLWWEFIQRAKDVIGTAPEPPPLPVAEPTPDKTTVRHGEAWPEWGDYLDIAREAYLRNVLEAVGVHPIGHQFQGKYRLRRAAKLVGLSSGSAVKKLMKKYDIDHPLEK